LKIVFYYTLKQNSLKKPLIAKVEVINAQKEVSYVKKHSCFGQDRGIRIACLDKTILNPAAERKM